MKPTFTFNDKLLDNADKFQHPFFKRFNLRPAAAPLQLDDKVSKNYLFPTFYSDVTCAQAIFLCDYKKAENIMPHPKIKPVMMTFGRAIVAFSCYEYKNVMGVPPYNEIAMTIPVLVDPTMNVPVLPMVTSKLFKEFGYYVFSMPVTSMENRIRGHKIWGLPKEVQEIDLFENDGDCVTVAKEESGEPYIELRVPMKGKKERFDETANLYTRLGDELLQSETNFKADFHVTKFMNLLFKKGAATDKKYLWLGDTPNGRMLKELEIEEHPFQLRYGKHMNSCFDLPNPNFKSPVTF